MIELGKMNSTSAAMKRSTQTAFGDQLNDMIRKKAYELYEKRGRKSGNALTDWLEAERIVKANTR